jgi:hypothetical protein
MATPLLTSSESKHDGGSLSRSNKSLVVLTAPIVGQLHRSMKANLILLLALLQPGMASALGIGEEQMLSKWGEPFHARVELRLSKGEQIDAACLSISPTVQEKGQVNTLRHARISLQVDKGRYFAVIVTREPFMALYASFMIRVACTGRSGMAKSITVLPDIPVSSAKIWERTARSVDIPQAKPDQTTDVKQMKLASIVQNPVKAKKKVSKSSLPSTKPHKRSKPKRTNEIEKESTFGLKLSSSSLDLSRSGKLSPADRAALAEQKKILDSDDEMARSLEMRYQIKTLSDELAVMKLKLSRLESLTANMVPTAPAAVTLESAQTSKAVLSSTEQGGMRWAVWLFGSLVLAAFGLFVFMRRRVKIVTALPVQKDSDPTPPLAKLQIPKPSQEASPAKEEAGERTAAYYSIASSLLVPEAPVPVGDEQINTLLEEAHLYAKHGRLSKATDILEDLLEQHPGNAEAWLRLLSVYSALCDTKNFEAQAKRFMERQPEQSVWLRVQALGRSLDAGNPLYQEAEEGLADSLFKPSREIVVPIGSVLVESGALSLTDLNNCLSEYDPKVNGRFGNYLVSRKLISVEQLTNALLQQQGITPSKDISKQPPSAEIGALQAEEDLTVGGWYSEALKGALSSSEPSQAQGIEEKVKPKEESVDFVIDFDTDQLDKK